MRGITTHTDGNRRRSMLSGHCAVIPAPGSGVALTIDVQWAGPGVEAAWPGLLCAAGDMRGWYQSHPRRAGGPRQLVEPRAERWRSRESRHASTFSDPDDRPGRASMLLGTPGRGNSPGAGVTRSRNWPGSGGYGTLVPGAVLATGDRTPAPQSARIRQARV